MIYPSPSAEALNGDCQAARLDRAALRRAMQARGSEWYDLAMERCPYIFADVALFIPAKQWQQMRAVIAAVENVAALPKWNESPHTQPLPRAEESLGVFYGYDFHLNSGGAHLIEINTNAGGGFLNALLLDSQRENTWPGVAVAEDNLEQIFLEMFQNEWQLARGEAVLHRIAIVDEQPQGQYLYPEFLLAQQLFEHAGFAGCIADPATLVLCEDGLCLESSEFHVKHRIDLVYNRLTDFSLQQYPVLRQAYLNGSVVLTPSPKHYTRYADKRNLVHLSDAAMLHALGADEADITVLQTGVPQTRLVERADLDLWWQERRQWFFKPAMGYGGKGSYRGEKLTRRVFEEIMQGGYVAQRMATPGERMVCVEGAKAQPFKYDVRCYVYDGQVQLLAARLYQGQTVNFRTPGGGFAPVYLVE